MFKDNNSQYKKQKSPQQRFLFVLGLLFFLIYLALGLIIIFWKTIPLNISYHGRLAFGALLIIYAFIRFVRLLKRNRE